MTDEQPAGSGPDADMVRRYQRSGRLHPLSCPTDQTALDAYDTSDGVRLACVTCGADVRLSPTAARIVTHALAIPADRFVTVQEDPT